jgi:hypothetical protein
MNKTKTKINTKVTSKTQDEENQPYYGSIHLDYLKQLKRASRLTLAFFIHLH